MQKNNIARRLSLSAAAFALTATILTGCRQSDPESVSCPAEGAAEITESTPDSVGLADVDAAEKVAALIDAIYVQRRTEETDRQCAAAKAAWDALDDNQRALVLGEFADPDYFGLDTGDASLDDPLNADGIGDRELLVVSFGTSFNESRAADIGGVERAAIAAAPEWAVRRAFTAQIIVNHIQARDGEKIDNIEQALDRAVNAGVKELVVLPSLLMRGAEYDEAAEVVAKYADKFESVVVASPLLGAKLEPADADAERAEVLTALVADAVKTAGFDSLDDAKAAGTALVLLGHGTSHSAKVAYAKSQETLASLGMENVFVGTVEGEPESTACEEILKAVAGAGYKNVVLRPFMVVAGDHANNDMAGDDPESWASVFNASGKFESVDSQILGMGRLPEIQKIYLKRLGEALEQLTTSEAQ